MKVLSRILVLALLCLIVVWAVSRRHAKATPAPAPADDPHPVITITNCQIDQQNYAVGRTVVDVTFRVTDNSQVAIQFLDPNLAKQGTRKQFAAPMQDGKFDVNPPPKDGKYWYIVWHNPADCFNLIGSTDADAKKPDAKLKGKKVTSTGDPNDITIP